ncbi:nose resistant to fluoxetine protein 6-like [Haemaphysalis longicornis]
MQEPDEFERYGNSMRKLIGEAIAKVPPDFIRKLQQAEVSTQCTLGLLKLVRGFKNLESWALRLFDASGKYPTGLLQGTRMDPGAFDECLETTVRGDFGHVHSRGQYCNLLVYVKNSTAWQRKMDSILEVMHPKMRYFKSYLLLEELPVLRLGLCFLDDCSQQDLQALVDSVKPPIIDLQVSNCITAEPENLDSAQKGIMIATVFSVAANSDTLLKDAEGNRRYQYDLRFVHGMRFISLAFVVLGHCYQVMSDTWSRILNMFIGVDYWPNMMVAAGFSCVDTFFFLSGFFLCLTVMKQRTNGPLVFLIGALRRLVRTCIPLVFVVICLCISRLFVNGPDAKAFFQKFDAEIAEHWWHLLLQIRNFFILDEKHVLVHMWYLSADYQLFLVALPTLLLLKSRPRLAIGAFTLLSLLGSAIATWTLAGTQMTPFIVFPTQSPQVVIRTANEYYIRPFCHAICYFSGCITFLVMNDFQQRKAPRAVQVIGWCVASCSALCCVFMKHAWYKHPVPTSEAGKLLTAFFDRVLWSLFLAWTTLACSTGRGGVVNKFLSWNAFVPLSRLSFGVYLIHYPFVELILHTSRERLFWSHFNHVTMFFGLLVWSLLLAYLAFLACEGPVGALDKLVFSKLTAKGGAGVAGKQKQPLRLTEDGLAEMKTAPEDFQVDSILANKKTNAYVLPDPINGTGQEQTWNSECVVRRL